MDYLWMPEILAVLLGVSLWANWRNRRTAGTTLSLAVRSNDDLESQLRVLRQEHGDLAACHQETCTENATLRSRYKSLERRHGRSKANLRKLRTELRELQTHAVELKQGVEAGVVLAALFGLLLKEGERRYAFQGERAEEAQRAAEAWRREADQLLNKAEAAAGRRLKASLLRLLVGWVPFGPAVETVFDGLDIPDTMKELEGVTEAFEVLKDGAAVPHGIGEFVDDLDVQLEPLHDALDTLLEPLKPDGSGSPDFSRLGLDTLRFARDLAEFREAIKARRLYRKVVQASHPLAVERRKKFGSRAAFARAVDIAPTTLANLERGAKPRPATVAKLAKGLSLPTDTVRGWFESDALPTHGAPDASALPAATGVTGAQGRATPSAP